MEAEIVEYSGGVVEWRFSDGTQYGGDITVHAEFTANVYSLTLEYSAGGSVTGGEQGTNYSYGTSVSMHIAAADGYYIRSVTVAGISYSPSQLNGAVLDGATNCFTSGTLTFRITGDTHVAIEFMPNSYTMIISDTLGGTTYVMTDAGGGANSYMNSDYGLRTGGTDLLLTSNSSCNDYKSDAAVYCLQRSPFRPARYP